VDIQVNAPAGTTIDWTALASSTASIVTLAGSGVGTAKIDTTQKPVVVGTPTSTSGTVRFWVTGSFDTSNCTAANTTALGVACVAAVFVPGGVPVTETLSSVVTVDAGTGTIDVSFPYPAGQHVGYAI